MSDAPKPWEETWTSDEERLYWTDGNRAAVFVGDASHPDEDDARAKLAAAAPEMARLLIEIRGAELVPGGLEDAIRAALKKAGVPDHT